MLYENSLIVPGSRGNWFFRKVVVPILFPELKRQAWIKHNVEEVGVFENFLPDLYRLHDSPSEASADREAVRVA